MFDLYKAGFGIAAGVAGTLFIGYCVYFDHKRRQDPDYKKKLRERRNRNRAQKNTSTANKNVNMPNLNDHEAIERYFLQEIQLGETQIARGDYVGGVEHLANAIAVCGQPARLLQVLQTSLPAQAFAMLILKMQEIGSRAHQEGVRIVTSAGGIGDEIGAGAPGAVIIDDLE